MEAKNVKLPWMTTTCKPEAGRAVLVEGWGGHCPSYLTECEIPEFAPFRLPSGRYTDVAYACRLEITGRVAQKLPYDDRLWVKVKITFVGDGEPDAVSAGWMAV